jgi:hypothetical protein
LPLATCARPPRACSGVPRCRSERNRHGQSHLHSSAEGWDDATAAPRLITLFGLMGVIGFVLGTAAAHPLFTVSRRVRGRAEGSSEWAGLRCCRGRDCDVRSPTSAPIWLLTTREGVMPRKRRAAAIVSIVLFATPALATSAVAGPPGTFPGQGTTNSSNVDRSHCHIVDPATGAPFTIVNPSPHQGGHAHGAPFTATPCP